MSLKHINRYNHAFENIQTVYIRDNYAPYKPCCLGYDPVYYDRLSEGKDSLYYQIKLTVLENSK